MWLVLWPCSHRCSVWHHIIHNCHQILCCSWLVRHWKLYCLDKVHMMQMIFLEITLEQCQKYDEKVIFFRQLVNLCYKIIYTSISFQGQYQMHFLAPLPIFQQACNSKACFALMMSFGLTTLKSYRFMLVCVCVCGNRCRT